MTLRHIPDLVADGVGYGRFPGHHTAAARPRQDAEQTAEECGLADAVASENRQYLACGEGEVQPRKEFCFAVVRKCGVLHLDHDQSPIFSRVRLRSTAKKGAPSSAVRMPIGSSAASRLRAQMSTSARKIAPTKQVAGSSR